MFSLRAIAVRERVTRNQHYSSVLHEVSREQTSDLRCRNLRLGQSVAKLRYRSKYYPSYQLLIFRVVYSPRSIQPTVFIVYWSSKCSLSCRSIIFFFLCTSHIFKIRTIHFSRIIHASRISPWS